MRTGGAGAGPSAWLALAALVLGGLALVPGGARAPGPGSGAGVAELTRELASGAGTVDALELAGWIRERRPVRVLDVRDSSAHVRFSIPTAEHATLEGLAALDPGGEVPLVLYGDGDGRAVRAWLLLRRLGHPRARLLAGGVVAWVDEVIEPVLPAGTPAERARFDRVAELSRYFGGVPRVGERDTLRARGPARAEAAVRLLSRRGCY
jgi:rhodanese-related sulfurtransferase